MVKVKEMHEKKDEKGGKTKALGLAIDQIEKQFGKGSIMKLGEGYKVDVPAVPTGALSLDMALGVGGLPRGRAGRGGPMDSSRRRPTGPLR